VDLEMPATPNFDPSLQATVIHAESAVVLPDTDSGGLTRGPGWRIENRKLDYRRTNGE
jgi:hypothetical protein